MAKHLPSPVQKLLREARADYERAHDVYVTPDWHTEDWYERDTRAQKLVNIFGRFCDGDFTAPYFTTLFHIALPDFPDRKIDTQKLEAQAKQLQEQFGLTDHERQHWMDGKIKHSNKTPAEFGVWVQSEKDIVENGLFLEKLRVFVDSRRDGKWYGDSLVQGALPNQLSTVASIGDVSLLAKYIPYTDTATQETRTHSIMYDAVRSGDAQLVLPTDYQAE